MLNSNRLLRRLLRKNVSPLQLAGYALANLLGLAIVMAAIQFYADARSAVAGDDAFMAEDYMIVSKPVVGLGSLLGGNADFSPEEIEELRRQPWVVEVGEFSAAAFDVFASVNIGGSRLSTSLFLEAIPDEFFDVKPRDWDSREFIPIILSKDYLTLYNFGYAAARGMPQLSEGMMAALPLHLSFSGNGRQESHEARIVGFSSRLNTIAVPLSLLSEANARFAPKSLPPSRLIIKLNREGDPQAKAWLDYKGWEIAGDKGNSGKAAFFLRVATSVVIAVGLVISLLAFFILLLSVWLLLQKNREKLHRLLELGYSCSAVAAPYFRLTAWINSAVFVGASLLMFAARAYWKAHLAQLGLAGASPWLAVAIGAVLMLAITLANFLAIRRKVDAAFLR